MNLNELHKAFIDYEADFPENWHKLLAEVFSDGEDAMWMMGHANYFLRTGGVRWAVDPALRTAEMMDAAARAAGLFAKLDFVLITHFHRDHFVGSWISSLPDSETLWIVPDFAGPQEREAIAKVHSRVRFVRPGESIDVCGIRIDVLEGHHYDEGTTVGVKENAYLISANGKKLFMPCDVRDYSMAFPDECRGADLLPAHVWLGRGKGLLAYEDTLLTQYAGFLASLAPKRLLLAHLYDLTRPPKELWTLEHALAVREKVLAQNPDINIEIPAPMKKIIL